MPGENEEEKPIESNGGGDPSGVDYIEAMKKMRENSVTKEAYEKLKEENAKLLQSLISGETIAPDQTEKPDISALRKELFSEDSDLSNLQYAKKVLELRQAIIDDGGVDPFLPYGNKIVPTEEDITTANRVATILSECVDYADGDSEIFTNELQRRMIDTAPKKGGKRK